MVRIDKKARRAYVLDTNVLIHDPACLYKFKEHDVIIPMTVLEELDHLKRGNHDAARSARQASRNLSALLDQVDMSQVAGGVPLGRDGSGGRLHFLMPAEGEESAVGLDAGVPDNRIIAEARAARKARADETVILVSKDVNLRVKCAALGIPVEDYRNDRVLDDIDAMFSGVQALGSAFWERLGADIESWQQSGRSYYRVQGEVVQQWMPGLLVCEHEEGGGFEALVRSVENDTAVLEVCRDFRAERHAVWGANAHNSRQNFAFNILLDPQIDLVTLAGPAGTGKTYLALAAGLHQVYEERRFERIIVTRETIPMGEDIGFLPGTEEEKMAPWMGGIQDNLDALLRTDDSWAGAATKDMLAGRVLFRSLGFMRGRTFNDTFLIVDEAQNLSPKQMKNLVTRAGRNTKIVCLGNVNQIDSPYLTETSSGLTYLVQSFQPWEHAAHVTLQDVERSRLAVAAEALL
ncbi:PhoH-like ATPase [Natronocella acetinitrilica]|uniref:PhoH-like ATPase n=1 Tax=Natronocella acetinitrilica TaxID=414046 RepID=A0AAE3G687_9GAMM|nr:PhoH family protein [Natronocella acetinitrilica]MCP1675178.1 PhoH-like ATPase [Natronocella acetinitrilica]